MLKFYESDLIQITNEDETLTVEQSITVLDDSQVTITLNVPRVAAGIRVYRSSTTNTETLLMDIPLPDNLRENPGIFVPFSLVDDGTLSPGATAYPTTTSLTVDEQRAVPVPSFTLEEVESVGSLVAGDYFYRISFYTVEDLATVYTEKDVTIKFYKPDLTKVMTFTRADMTLETDYTEISDPFAYVLTFSDDLLLSTKVVDNQQFFAQEIKVASEIVVKIVNSAIPVTINVATSNVLVNDPVLLTLSPSDIEIQVIESAITGPSEKLYGVTVKSFADPGTVSYFPSAASKFLFLISGGSFKVIS